MGNFCFHEQQGSIQKTGTKAGGVSYTVTGIIEVVDDTTLRITELPIRRWSQDYKEFLISIGGTDKSKDKDKDKGKGKGKVKEKEKKKDIEPFIEVVFLHKFFFAPITSDLLLSCVLQFTGIRYL